MGCVHGLHLPRPRQRGFLSRELIIETALALLDAHGPGALSMRRVADHLGVAPNALYTHVRGKTDLVEGLIDQVYAGLELDPDPARDWTEQLAAISRDVRAHLLAHPAVVPFAIQQPGLGPHGLRLGEAIYDVLRPAGLPDQAVVGAVYALLTYILGFVALEVPRAGTDPQTSDEFVRRLHGFFAALPRASSPIPSRWPLCWPALHRRPVRVRRPHLRRRAQRPAPVLAGSRGRRLGRAHLRPRLPAGLAPPDRALRHLEGERGAHFDPRCLDAFLALMAERGRRLLPLKGG
jgi:AcrR family transcriptional regulator